MIPPFDLSRFLSGSERYPRERAVRPHSQRPFCTFGFSFGQLFWLYGDFHVFSLADIFLLVSGAVGDLPGPDASMQVWRHSCIARVPTKTTRFPSLNQLLDNFSSLVLVRLPPPPLDSFVKRTSHHCSSRMGDPELLQGVRLFFVGFHVLSSSPKSLLVHHSLEGVRTSPRTRPSPRCLRTLRWVPTKVRGIRPIL
jgi:hypothetical protein